MSEVALLIDGTRYIGWKAVSVRRSLDFLASTFELTLTDHDRLRAGRRIRLGSACRIEIDGERIVTGYVDKIMPRYDGRERSLTVSGRAKTADLVDCSLPGKIAGKSQFNGLTFDKLAAVVASYVGVAVRDEVGGYEPIINAVYEDSQTIFEFLEVRSRMEAVLLTTNAAGDLVITRASNRHATTALELGTNILAADGEFSQRDRFSDYYVEGQRSRQASWDEEPEVLAHVFGHAQDTAVRYRPTTLLAEDSLTPADARRRAEWQRNVAYGRSRRATYAVHGWKHRDGLWEPNHLVRVIDPWMGFDDEWLMIATVEYLLDDRGERTRLTVMPKEAFDLVPLPAEDDEEFRW